MTNYNVQSYYTQNGRTYGKSTGFKTIHEAIDNAKRWSHAYICTVYSGEMALFTYKNGMLLV